MYVNKIHHGQSYLHPIWKAVSLRDCWGRRYSPFTVGSRSGRSECWIQIAFGGTWYGGDSKPAFTIYFRLAHGDKLQLNGFPLLFWSLLEHLVALVVEQSQLLLGRLSLQDLPKVGLQIPKWEFASLTPSTFHQGPQMSSVLQLALHIRGRRACDHRSAKRKSHWPHSVIKAFPRIHCSFIHCSIAHQSSPMIQCFSGGHHGTQKWGLAGYETKFSVTERWPITTDFMNIMKHLSISFHIFPSYVILKSWRSWAKPPPAPWRLLGGHPHLDMSRYPKPSAPWPPMTFWRPGLHSLHVYQTFSTSFIIFLQPSQSAFKIGRPPAIHSSNRVKTWPAPPFSRCWHSSASILAAAAWQKLESYVTWESADRQIMANHNSNRVQPGYSWWTRMQRQLHWCKGQCVWES